MLQRQLDPVWHSVSRKLKQIVYDLRTLRNLATYLLRYDAVTFLRYLETLRVAEGRESVWLYTDAAHTIFEQAKRRRLLRKSNAGAAGPRSRRARRRRARRRDGDRRARGDAPGDRARPCSSACPSGPCSRRSSRSARLEKRKLRLEIATSQEDEENADAAEDAAPRRTSRRRREADGELRAHAGGGRFEAGPASGGGQGRPHRQPARQPVVLRRRKADARHLGRVLASRRGDRRARRRPGPAIAHDRGGGEGRARGAQGAREGQSREAAEPHGPHARGDDGRGGRRQTGGGRGGRGAARRLPTPRAGLAGGGSVAERAAVAAAANALAQGIPTRARGGGGRDGGRGEGGPQGGPRHLGPAACAWPAAKKRKTGKAATASAAADSDDDVRIIGETFGRPTSVVEDVDDDEDVDVDAPPSRGVYVTSLTDRGGASPRRGTSFVVTYDPDAASHPRDRDAQALRGRAPSMRVYFLGARHLAGGAAVPVLRAVRDRGVRRADPRQAAHGDARRAGGQGQRAPRAPRRAPRQRRRRAGGFERSPAAALGGPLAPRIVVAELSRAISSRRSPRSASSSPAGRGILSPRGRRSAPPREASLRAMLLAAERRCSAPSTAAGAAAALVHGSTPSAPHQSGVQADACDDRGRRTARVHRRCGVRSRRRAGRFPSRARHAAKAGALGSTRAEARGFGSPKTKSSSSRSPSPAARRPAPGGAWAEDHAYQHESRLSLLVLHFPTLG